MTNPDKLVEYTSTGQIAACRCGSFPRLYGDGAIPDDGYRSLWCQTCMEHVTSMMPSEQEVLDHWNSLREREAMIHIFWAMASMGMVIWMMVWAVIDFTGAKI